MVVAVGGLTTLEWSPLPLRSRVALVISCALAFSQRCGTTNHRSVSGQGCEWEGFHVLKGYSLLSAHSGDPDKEIHQQFWNQENFLMPSCPLP